MRLKSFYARTMTEAMQMVRDTLGENAIIVATREEKGGKTVHVTAAVEPAFELGRSGAAAAEDWLQYDEEEDQTAVTEDVTDAMLRHSVPEEVMDQIISCVSVVGLQNPAAALTAALEHLYSFKPLPQRRMAKPLIAVGPPGAGKTLAIAKIAARAAMNDLKVAVITSDIVRAGGVEQLEAFTNLLRIPLQKASSAKDLRYMIADLENYDQILVDTPGLNPFDKNEVKTLAQMIAGAEGEPVMVLPGGTDAEEAGEMARVFSTIGAHSLLPTRVDMARRLGGLLAAAHYGRLIFSDAANTPKVAEGLMPLSPQGLAKLLFPRAFAGQRGSAQETSGPQRKTRA